VRTDRGLDRFITFLDAVVAIAITLLVLPLAEAIGGEHVPAHVRDVFTQNGARFFAFLLSFAVIARLWWAHHRLGGRVRAVNGPFVLLNLAWVFTIAVLPFATQVVAVYPPVPLAVATYIGTITASSACIAVLDWMVVRRDGLRREGMAEDARAGLLGGVVTTGLFAVALLLGVALRPVNYYGLLLLLLSGPIERAVARRRR